MLAAITIAPQFAAPDRPRVPNLSPSLVGRTRPDCVLLIGWVAGRRVPPSSSLVSLPASPLLTSLESLTPRHVHSLGAACAHCSSSSSSSTRATALGCVGPDIRRTNLLGDSCRQCAIGMVCIIFTCQYGDQCSLHCFFSSSRDPRENGGSNGTRGDVTPGGSQSSSSHPPPLDALQCSLVAGQRRITTARFGLVMEDQSSTTCQRYATLTPTHQSTGQEGCPSPRRSSVPLRESVRVSHTWEALGDVDDAGVAALGLLDLPLAGGILALLSRCGM